MQLSTFYPCPPVTIPIPPASSVHSHISKTAIWGWSTSFYSVFSCLLSFIFAILRWLDSWEGPLTEEICADFTYTQCMQWMTQTSFFLRPSRSWQELSNQKQVCSWLLFSLMWARRIKREDFVAACGGDFFFFGMEIVSQTSTSCAKMIFFVCWLVIVWASCTWIISWLLIQ